MPPEASSGNDGVEMQAVPPPPPAIAVTTADISSKGPPQNGDPSRTPSPLSSHPETPVSNASLTPATSHSSELSADPDACDFQRPENQNNSSPNSIPAPAVSNNSAPSSRPHTPPSSSTTSSSIAAPTAPSRTWSRRLLPNEHRAQHIIGFGVCAMTIATVVYTRRADISQRWNNLIALYQYCQQSANESICDTIDGKPLPPPPFETGGTFSTHLHGRDPNGTEAVAHMREHSAVSRSMWIAAITAVCAGTLVIALVLLRKRFLEHRRKQQVRLSDQSMARSEPPRQTSTSTTSGTPGLVNSGPRRRYRAFVTAEQAINEMKSANSSQTSLNEKETRSSSNPWNRRFSWMTGSNSSILNQADVALYDAEDNDEPWQKVKRASSPSRKGTMTLNSPPTKLHSPPSLIKRSETSESHGTTNKLKRWFTPGTVKVHDQPIPELDSGDADAATAFIGASLAATTGGPAMSKCPVEVPIDPKKLPDSWMHTAPQDESSASAVPCA